MKKWEYQVVVMPSRPDNCAKVLNEWGDDGWELAWMDKKEHGTVIAYFRRPS